MNDRISTEVLANGAIRYAEYDSSGNLIGYKYFKPADEPSEDGTPINKATLLKDATAELFGQPNTAVPDDVLAWLGRYAEYYWKRRAAPNSYREKQTRLTSSPYRYYWLNINGTHLYRSEQVTVNTTTGAVSLSNPILVTSMQQVKVGDYLYSTDGGIRRGSEYDDYIYDQITLVKTLTYDAGGATSAKYDIQANTWYEISSEVFQDYGAWETIYDTQRDAYPDSGISGGYEYEYLGVPFEKLPTAPQIETGSYVGTGTHGSANKNTINLSFNPKMVLVMGGYGGTNNPSFQISLMLRDAPYAYSSKESGNTEHHTNFVSFGDKTVSWYNNTGYSDAAYGQLNGNGYTYYYIAIG